MPRDTDTAAVLRELVSELHTLRREVAELKRVQASAPRTRTRQTADGRRITGWRFERGTHGGGCVRDPEGTDRPEWW
jgi:hypothetical protein